MAPRRAPLDRETVVQAAAELIDSGGLDALTLTSLASVCGVTQPALYRHVSGLDDVWRELGLQTRTDLAAALAQAGIGLSGSDAVRAVAHAWRAFGHRHPGRYRSTERSAVRDDPELEAAVQRVVDVLAMSMRDYGFGPDELGHGALLLRSALHGFVSFELGDGNPRQPSVDDTFERLLAMLCSGFETSAHTARA